MVLEFQTLAPGEFALDEPEVVPDPQIRVIEVDGDYGKVAIEPLERGYGVTLGNPMRRILYSSLSGTAVTWVKIEGILHEYATIAHVKEEVAEFLLNVKGIRLRTEVGRAGKLRMEVSGLGEVSASDIMASSDMEVVNPELHLATLTSDEARLSVEFNVEAGVGYRAAAIDEDLPIGVLPVDAIFTPIRKANYSIEPTRVGQRTDFERLVLEVWTDGSITPIDAVRKAADILISHLYLFNSVSDDDAAGLEGLPESMNISPDQYNIPIEKLDLSSRTLNCLRRAGLDKVGQVLSMRKGELMAIRNFGAKSYSELCERLISMGLPVPLEDNEGADAEPAGAEAAEED